MRRIKLTIAYDGTNYCGWQVQPNGTAIQEVLQAAIEDLVQHPINLTGASRTDSGVHALGQVAIFDTEMPWPAERFAPAINRRLPRDIVIQSSCEVPLDFHPRYRSLEKTYCYKILNRRMALPNERYNSYFVDRRVSLVDMQAAAKCLCGKHDFKSFCSVKTTVDSTVRTIYRLDVEKKDDFILLTITGDGFLYNMVRIIAGTLLKVGYGQMKPEDITRILEAGERTVAGPTAPPHGLTLVEIKYLENPKI